MSVTLDDIERARQTLSDVAYRTSLVHDEMLNGISGNQIYLKMENLQRTGSFKLRGAYNRIANLAEDEKRRGVIASSAGNHAQGVALAAQVHGIKATIVMPKHAPLSKVKATKSYGAEVVLFGEMYDEAYAEAIRIQQQTNATFIHPFNDPLVIAGQGTIGMEIIEDLPDVEIVVVPIGGGGLISGIATAIKNCKPGVKVIGVQARNMPSMLEAVHQNKMITIKGSSTIADGIAVKTPGEVTFDIVRRYVDDIVTVDEDEIASAILFLLEKMKIVSEGAGAVPMAAILNKFSQYRGKKIVAVVSGGNIDVNMLSRIIDQGLVKSRRKIYCDTVIPDKPGTLWRLIKLVSDAGANIISITHKRDKRNVSIGYVYVELELETADEEQIRLIGKLLAEHGYKVDLC